MKKLIAIIMVMVFGLVILSGCATNRTREGAAWGAGAGTIAAVLLDKSTATSALLILGGALLGGAIGNEMDEQERARQVSMQNPNKKVLLVAEEPSNERTDCKKVTTTTWKNGKQIKTETKEESVLVGNPLTRID